MLMKTALLFNFFAAWFLNRLTSYELVSYQKLQNRTGALLRGCLALLLSRSIILHRLSGFAATGCVRLIVAPIYLMPPIGLTRAAGGRPPMFNLHLRHSYWLSDWASLSKQAKWGGNRIPDKKNNIHRWNSALPFAKLSGGEAPAYGCCISTSCFFENFLESTHSIRSVDRWLFRAAGCESARRSCLETSAS